MKRQCKHLHWQPIIWTLSLLMQVLNNTFSYSLFTMFSLSYADDLFTHPFSAYVSQSDLMPILNITAPSATCFRLEGCSTHKECAQSLTLHLKNLHTDATFTLQRHASTLIDARARMALTLRHTWQICTTRSIDISAAFTMFEYGKMLYSLWVLT